jgi:hypothetical protein
MAVISEDTVMIRHIQGLTALLSCLPAGGKAKELFTLALALDESAALEKVGPPSDPDDDDAMKAWFEQLWAEDGLTPEEKELVDWQADSDNMTAALAEFKNVAAKLGTS